MAYQEKLDMLDLVITALKEQEKRSHLILERFENFLKIWKICRDCLLDASHLNVDVLKMGLIIKIVDKKDCWECNK